MKPYSNNPQTEKSLHASLREGVAHAIMTGGLETYFSAFALFLKASAPQVALIATLPAALGSLAQLISAWMGRRLNRRKPIIVFSALFQALLLPCLLLLPFLPGSFSIYGLVFLLIMYFSAANMIVPQWCSLMSELVPERKRGRYFGFRTRIATLASFIALVLGGVGLHLLATLDKTMTGFVLLIGVAFLARLYSTRQMHKMTEPVPHSVAMDVEKNLSWLRLPQFAAAKRFSVFVILMHMSVGIAAPFFSVYMLVDLQYSYLQFMLNTGAAVIVQVWTLNYWGRISDIFGSHSAILVSSVLVPVLPALWLVSDNFIWLLVVQLLAGFAWAGFSLSTSNALYELIPQSKMATYQALHNVLMAFAVFVGGMIGVLIIESFPVRLAFGTFSLQWSSVLLWVFLVSGICRASVAVFMLPRLAKFGRGRKSASGYQLIFRLVRFNAFMGLVYEVVAKTKRPS